MPWITEQNRKWWTVAAMGLVLFFLSVDFTGVPVVLPDIGRDLDTSTTSLQWTINAYLLAFAAPTVAFGRLADIFGRRRLVLIGAVVFVVGSALCGLAQADWQLIFARVVQGVGAAPLFAVSLSIVSNAFPPEQRSRGIGIWVGIGAFGNISGPLVAGLLAGALSWRWLFLVNIPIAVLAIFLIASAVRESRDETVGQNVDVVGVFTITVGAAALVVALQQSETSGWGSPVVIVSLVAAVVLLALFLFIEPRLRYPLIELGLFNNRSYLGANLVAFTGNFGFMAIMFFLALYFQNALGYSALGTGLLFLAFLIPFAIFNFLAGRIASAVGLRSSLAGCMALVAVSFLLLALITPTSGLVVVIVALAIAGVGQALSYTLSSAGGMAAIPDAKAGAGSGLLNMIRLLGSVFGVAVTGALFKALENDRLAELLTAAGASLDASDQSEIQGLLSGSEAAEARLSQLTPEVAEQIEEVVREAFVYAFDGAMLLCMAVSIVGVLASFLIARGDPEPKQTDRPAGANASTGYQNPSG